MQERNAKDETPNTTQSQAQSAMLLPHGQDHKPKIPEKLGHSVMLPQSESLIARLPQGQLARSKQGQLANKINKILFL